MRGATPQEPRHAEGQPDLFVFQKSTCRTCGKRFCLACATLRPPKNSTRFGSVLYFRRLIPPVVPRRRTRLAAEAGACTAPGDADAFADALRQLISDPKQRLIAGKCARALAEERFGKDAVLERFEEQLLQLVESRRFS